MSNVFIKTAIALFLFHGSYGAFAQGVHILEDDIDFKVLKWHYDKYPHTTTEWKVVAVKGKGERFLASFAFNSLPTKVLYSENGVRIIENSDLTKNVPVSLIHYLDDMYAKYKVLSFTRLTRFEPEEITSYTMEVKSKEAGLQVIEFDGNLIPLDSILVRREN